MSLCIGETTDDVPGIKLWLDDAPVPDLNEKCDANANLIAHAPADLTTLCDLVQLLQADIVQIKAARDENYNEYSRRLLKHDAELAAAKKEIGTLNDCCVRLEGRFMDEECARLAEKARSVKLLIALEKYTYLNAQIESEDESAKGDIEFVRDSMSEAIADYKKSTI